ncbi:hypothetical protein FOA43_003435 [Brettanomyces nanus]|uniref:Uncharacterized protein n=1 Tax=Eeniella nana TaxID=13502 RepID=A0A875S8P7_EENNA|nr:uncharacterized protein FOA43_003435 [Brettanomyces nanus]QPG76049.1 hypothetical protein FOA43_003435 [Brettanomyces nanus]
MSFVNRGLIRSFKYGKQPQLYIHEISKDLVKASFSSNPSKLEVGTFSGIPPLPNMESQLAISTKNFVPNKDFFNLLQGVFNKHVYEDEAYKLDALNFTSSYLPIGDYKVVLQFMNQRPEYENTLGFVRVNGDGIMIKDSYQANDIYELCNSDGIVTLSDFMLKELQKQLKE